MFLSPFIYFFLRKNRLGWTNLIVVILWSINWIYVISNYKLNPVFSVWKITWGVLLFISLCFLLAAVSWIYLKIASFNRYLLPLLIMFGVAVSAHIYYDDQYGLIKWSVNNLVKFLLFYMLPVYLITIFITGIISFIIHRIINRGGAI
jgi:hypothetical protein